DQTLQFKSAGSKDPDFGSAIANKLMNSRVLPVLLTIFRSPVSSTSTHTNCLIQLVKERFA
ncbi:hypothetical protein, partial [Azotobacter chroococcum]|uniref:hypothetical protein n=1 Tax=Azotobacter chroococcum TaxID=353 RepID=UPI0019393128